MFVETETEENPNHNCIHKNGIHTRVHLFLQLGICWIAFGKISLWRPCNQLLLKVNENMHEHAHFCLSAQMSTCNPTNHIICCVCTECESKNAKQSDGEKREMTWKVDFVCVLSILKGIRNWSVVIMKEMSIAFCKMITFECGTYSFTSTPIFTGFIPFLCIHNLSCNSSICITHTLQTEWMALNRPSLSIPLSMSICKYNFHKRNRIRFR